MITGLLRDLLGLVLAGIGAAFLYRTILHPGTGPTPVATDPLAAAILLDLEHHQDEHHDQDHELGHDREDHEHEEELEMLDEEDSGF